MHLLNIPTLVLWAVIGQNKAVANLGFAKLSGFLAWLIWVVAHIYYLIEFDNKLVVMIQWAWNYITQGRGARLITGKTAIYANSGSEVTADKKELELVNN